MFMSIILWHLLYVGSVSDEKVEEEVKDQQNEEKEEGEEDAEKEGRKKRKKETADERAERLLAGLKWEVKIMHVLKGKIWKYM